jgi:uncharacterized membrane protein
MRASFRTLLSLALAASGLLLAGTGLAGPRVARPPRGQPYFVELQSSRQAVPIKQTPGRGGRAVSAIAIGTPPVVATGRQRKVGRALWLEVEHQGIRGWVLGRTVRPASGSAELVPLPDAPHQVFVEDLVCLGGPPGWKMVIDRDGSVDCSDGCRGPGRLMASAARRTPDRRAAWTMAIKDPAGGNAMTVFLRHTGQCQDGASVSRFAYRIAVRTAEGRKLHGCCNLIGPPPP